MRILITGSEGNIGRRLLPYLEKFHEVYGIDQVQGSRKNYAVVNICQAGDLLRAFREFEPEVVFHLAAMVSRVTCEASPGITIDTNLSGLNNVIQACMIYEAKLIYFSTSEVYGNIGGVLSEDRECKPNNLYGLTKYLGEKLVEYNMKEGLRAITVRPFMFYDEMETIGAHRSAMIRFCSELHKGNKITVHLNSRRSWLHTEDAVEILKRLINIDGCPTMNIGSNELISTRDLAMLICAWTGRSYKDHVIEEKLPAKMTLDKIPDVMRQTTITGYIPRIPVRDGIIRIMRQLEHDGNNRSI